MATLSLTVGPFTATKTISAADLTRMLNAYRAIYGQVPIDPLAVPIVLRDMTDQETFNKFAAGIYQGIIDNIKRAEQTIAAQTAVTTVTSVTLT